MASADYSVLTPERVTLEYGIAGIGSRGAAVVVDTLLQIFALCVVAAGMFGLAVAEEATRILTSGAGTAPTVFRGIIIGLFFLALFLITSGYFIVFEIVWSGQTPGKRLLGLRVIRESGYPIRPVDAVIRNLVRMVDWLPVIYGTGVLVMLLNRRSKRLGDFASGTIVVREGARRAMTFIPPPTEVEGEPQHGFALTGSDATLVRDFLVRRDGLDSRVRADLASRLAAAISQRYHVPLVGDPERYLERLAG